MLRNSSILDKDRIKTETNSASYPHGLASGSHDMHDAHHKLLKGIWPKTWKVVSITSPSSVNEGSSFSIGITTLDIPDGTTLYYTIATVSGTGMTNADFSASPGSQGISGSWTNTQNNTTLNFTLVPGDGTENNVFKFQVRVGSISGDIIGESNNVTVVDAVGIDLRSGLYEISNRVIFDPTSADYTGNWDVGEVVQAYTGSARVYLALKCTASTTFYNDICIAAVQVLNSSNVIQKTWNFSAGNAGWISLSGRINSTSALLNTVTTPQTFSQSTPWTTMGTGASTGAVTVASGTGSSNTGMADGIANSTSTVYNVGNAQVPQVLNTNYIYGEVSGVNRYSYVVCANGNPNHTFTAGDKIRVVHSVTTLSGQPVNANDSLWIGMY